uniref:GSVIVT00014538001 n=1 Tax=Arundo donax TaxID=35708 RepID=A0A0A9DH40_ARUDO
MHLAAKIQHKQNHINEYWLLHLQHFDKRLPAQKEKEARTLPTTPSFSPHHRFVRLIRIKCVTVETIACIYHWVRCVVLLAHHPRHTSAQSLGHLRGPIDI